MKKALLILCVSILFIAAEKTNSWLVKPTLIYSGIPTQTVLWSADSHRIAFANWNGVIAGIDMDESSLELWFQYDTQTKVFSRTSRWPLQPHLTRDDQVHFNLRSIIEQLAVYESPSRTYLSFVISQGEQGARISLYRRDTMEQAILPQNFNSTGGPNIYYILWSADETALVAAGKLGPESPFPVFVSIDKNDISLSQSYFDLQVEMDGRVFLLSQPQRIDNAIMDVATNTTLLYVIEDTHKIAYFAPL